MNDDVANPDNAPDDSGGRRSPDGSQNVLAGLMGLAFSGLSLYLIWDLPMMRGARIGVGYFPKILIALIAIMAIFLFVRGLMGRGEGIRLDTLRPVFFVIASFVVFGLLISRVGFFLSCMALVLVACAAQPSYKPTQAILLAIALSSSAAVIFIKLLQVPVSIFPW